MGDEGKEGKDAAQKRRLTIKVKRLDQRAGLERAGQGDGPLLADRVVWEQRDKERKRSEGMSRGGGDAEEGCAMGADGSASKNERTNEGVKERTGGRRADARRRPAKEWPPPARIEGEA